MTPARVTVAADRSTLVTHAAEWLLSVTTAAIARRGRCAMAISGGSTPLPLFELLATPEWRTRVDWQRVALFWVDERFVPPDDARSNAGTVGRVLLPHVAIPSAQVHAIPTDTGTPGDAAARYDATLRYSSGVAGVPALDVVLLGLGDDGHTASLFPHSPVLRVAERLVAADPVRRDGSWRVTMTLPLLNAARHVAFLVAGPSKADVVHAALSGTGDPEHIPARLVQPLDGSLHWFLDRAAAARVRRPRVPAERDRAGIESFRNRPVAGSSRRSRSD